MTKTNIALSFFVAFFFTAWLTAEYRADEYRRRSKELNEVAQTALVAEYRARAAAEQCDNKLVSCIASIGRMVDVLDSSMVEF